MAKKSQVPTKIEDTQYLTITNDMGHILDAANVLVEDPNYARTSPEEVSAVVKGLIEECGEEVAHNFLHQLMQFREEEDEFDLSAGMDFDLESGDSSNAPKKYVTDPVKEVSLVQAMTNDKPEKSDGCYIDSKMRNLVLKTWDTKQKSSIAQKIFALSNGFISRSYYDVEQKKSKCFSVNGQVNKFGGLCKNCEMSSFSRRKAKLPAACRDQAQGIFITADFAHMFRVRFGKTQFKPAWDFFKKVKNSFKKPYSAPVWLKTAEVSNDVGSWFVPAFNIETDPSERATPHQIKAMDILAKCYLTFFIRLNQSLVERHKDFLQRKKEDPTLTGMPQSDEFSGMGVGNAFSAEAINVSSIGDAPDITSEVSAQKPVELEDDGLGGV